MISSTYMAACGLQPGRKNSLEPAQSSGSNGIVQDQQNQALASAAARSSSSFAGAASAASRLSEATTGSLSVEPYSRGDNARVMAGFAAAMMRAIRTSSQDGGFSFQMRIGRCTKDVSEFD